MTEVRVNANADLLDEWREEKQYVVLYSPFLLSATAPGHSPSGEEQVCESSNPVEMVSGSGGPSSRSTSIRKSAEVKIYYIYFLWSFANNITIDNFFMKMEWKCWQTLLEEDESDNRELVDEEESEESSEDDRLPVLKLGIINVSSGENQETNPENTNKGVPLSLMRWLIAMSHPKQRCRTAEFLFIFCCWQRALLYCWS